MKGIIKFSPYITLIGLSVGYIVYSVSGDMVEQTEYDKLKDEYVKEYSIENTSPIITLDENIEVDETLETDYQEVIEEVEEPEIISNELLELGYNFKVIDFDSLKEKNQDVCSWIELPGTKIDYPIVYATDKENEYYLHHDLSGNKTSAGTIYIDNRCSKMDEEISPLTVTYGHNMKNKSMYKAISYYQNKDFIKNHPFIVIYTPDGYAYKAEIIGGYIEDGKNDAYVDISSEEKFTDYINYVKENSNFDTDVEAVYGDKLMSFVTCEYTRGNNSRYILVAKLEKQYTNELQYSKNIDNNYIANR